MEEGFATALGRLGVIISRTDIHEAKNVMLKRASTFQSRHETLSDLATSISTLSDLDAHGLMSGPDVRWCSPPSISLDLSHSGSLMQNHFSKQVGPAVTHLTSSTTQEMYNEVNAPMSPGWMVDFSWILDRMYMFGIPAHYTLPDPAYLPIESMRFFHVDRNWIR